MRVTCNRIYYSETLGSNHMELVVGTLPALVADSDCLSDCTYHSNIQLGGDNNESEN